MYLVALFTIGVFGLMFYLADVGFRRSQVNHYYDAPLEEMVEASRRAIFGYEEHSASKRFSEPFKTEEELLSAIKRLEVEVGDQYADDIRSRSDAMRMLYDSTLSHVSEELLRRVAIQDSEA